MDKDIEYRFTKPDQQLKDYVDSIWMLKNHSEKDKDVVIVPDSRIDLFFSCIPGVPFNCILMGLESEPTTLQLPAKILTFAISFNLLAVEYVLKRSVADLVNSYRELPPGFWEITIDDLSDFERFCKKVSVRISDQLPTAIDNRKKDLFDLIYASHGALPVKDLSAKVFWSSRQINRYFNGWFGMSLKAYCNIVRFRASFQHIAEGKLFPEENFTDQAHFIKEIKKLSGVKPKELHKNQNDRFLQFLPLKRK
jgi:AraC-like DNA-binding protein